MLNKIISNLKKSLSPKSESEEKTDVSEYADSSDSTQTNIEDPSKKRNSMIIRVVIVIGIAYYGITEFVLKDSDNATEAIATVKPKKKKALKPIAETIAAPATETAVVATPTPATESVAPVPEATVATSTNVNTAPVEDVNISPKTIETSPEVKKEAENITPDQAPVTPQPIEAVKANEHLANVGENKSTEKQLDKDLDKLIENDDKKDGIKKPIIDLKDKILVEENYVEPPNYENVGRGLVYNCKEKFWVCVDRAAYITCNKNMKYNKANSKTIECAVASVYNSNEDCTLMQKHNITTSTSTEFCN